MLLFSVRGDEFLTPLLLESVRKPPVLCVALLTAESDPFLAPVEFWFRKPVLF